MSPQSKTVRLTPPVVSCSPGALTLLLLALVVSLVFAASIGALTIPIARILTANLTEQQQAVLLSIRIPRIALAGLVGAGLGVSGAALQGLFRNALADPGLIGIASGAAFAVATMIVIFGSLDGLLGLYGLSIAAFLGGLITSVIIFRFARLSDTSSVTYILLTGIAINALASAGTGFLAYLSDDQQLRTLTLWTMGSLGGALWPAVLIAATLILPAIWRLNCHAQQLNILLLGEEEAKYLGIDSKQLKRNIIILSAIAVGAAVAVSGIIGFVGLVIPHLIRLTLGPDHRLLMPASALLGATMLIIADTLARILFSPSEIPVGVLTSLIGGPFFLWLLLKQYSRRTVI